MKRHNKPMQGCGLLMILTGTLIAVPACAAVAVIFSPYIIGGLVLAFAALVITVTLTGNLFPKG